MWKIAQPTLKSHAERRRSTQLDGEQAGDQHEDELAGVHVAEQSHGQRHRLGQVLDQVEDEVRDRERDLGDRAVGVERRGEQLLGEAPAALGLDRVEDDQQEHGDRHRERGVEVGGRARRAGRCGARPRRRASVVHRASRRGRAAAGPWRS